MTTPEIGKPYTWVRKDGRKYTRTPMKVTVVRGETLIRYEIGNRHELRVCNLNDWTEWCRRIV